MKTYIIRIDCQDLAGKITWINGVGHHKNSMEYNEMIDNLKDNGLKIINLKAYSSFGACYFLEVSGKYKGEIKINILNILPSKFGESNY
jgi:hypothetical protein